MRLTSLNDVNLLWCNIKKSVYLIRIGDKTFHSSMLEMQ